MTNGEHLTEKDMTQALDRELSTAEQARVETHLANCEACLEAYERLVEVSTQISRAIEAIPVAEPERARAQLITALRAMDVPVYTAPASRWPFWVSALATAACLALATLLALQKIRSTPRQPASPPPARVVKRPPAPPSGDAQPRFTTQVGHPLHPLRHIKAPVAVPETEAEPPFIPLPYADPGLPLSATDRVRVEMRLSALAGAGVIRVVPGSADGLVQADVLLGVDGQPWGIRLVEDKHR